MDTTAPEPAEADKANVKASAGFLEGLSNTFFAARDSLSHLLELVSLEAQRAGLALVWMTIMGIVAAVCIVAAWLGLLVVLAMWAVSLGLSPILAVIVVTAINLVASAVLIYLCVNISQDLRFAATRRQLAGMKPASETTS